MERVGISTRRRGLTADCLRGMEWTAILEASHVALLTGDLGQRPEGVWKHLRGALI
jgi:hypothetical protein